MISEKLVGYNTRMEQLRQYQVSGTRFGHSFYPPAPTSLLSYESTPLSLPSFSLFLPEGPDLSSGATVTTPVPLGLKSGEKYRAPETRKHGGGFFGKKEKKTWGKF